MSESGGRGGVTKQDGKWSGAVSQHIGTCLAVVSAQPVHGPYLELAA